MCPLPSHPHTLTPSQSHTLTPSHSTLTLTQRAYSEATGGFAEGSTPRDRGTSLGRDDRIHGSLLIINELIMNSMWSDEVGHKGRVRVVQESCESRVRVV